ncbi:baculoviral IAP repeat-containing protein 7-like [Panonychus citri]|uniref:baculoviral IAP repeat-containing protein 7-like n=1 Tax=Panonychus citri TaxID=50023 RepID=UPI0023076D83|nr:baculoviral IAP repeat-containing protein 7-like [Panonychus citri]
MSHFQEYPYRYHYNYNGIGGSRPRHPEYRNPITRLESFVNWPRPDIDIGKLTDAGFFYEGNEDKVVCFHCDSVLFNWQTDDDPFVEHGIHSKNCYFMYVKCGCDFPLRCVLETKPQIPKPELPRVDIGRYKCKICREKEIGCIFHPCEHTVSCTDCAIDLDSCPICKTSIRKIRLSLVD